MRTASVQRERLQAESLERRAWTLVEILVVIGIIGIITSMSLPAVQRARESSRSLRCKNNLHQIGIALHGYQSQHGVFPGASAGALLLDPNSGDSRYFSPFVYLLPYLEQRAVYSNVNFQVRAFDPDANWDGPQNTTAFTQVIELFLCPSDSSPAAFSGRNNYRVNLGTGPRPRPPTNNGAFAPGLWASPAAFSDGMSLTVGMSEKIMGDGVATQYDPRRDIWFTPPVNAFPSIEQFQLLCSAPTTAVPPSYSFAGSSWFHAGFFWTWYNHAFPPNNRIPDCTTAQFAGAIPGIFSARSMHIGGVNCLFMDGNVRFIQDGIDIQVWRAIATRSGAEAVHSNSF